MLHLCYKYVWKWLVQINLKIFFVIMKMYPFDMYSVIIFFCKHYDLTVKLMTANQVIK